MAETQRRPVPRNDDGELDTALAFLTFARESVLIKTEGLSDEQLRRVLVESGTTLLGLVQHLTVAERHWFGHHLAGAEPDQEWDFDMQVPPDRSTAQVLDDYRAAIERSDLLVRGIGDPDAPAVQQIDGRHMTLRWVLAHMTTETVRHAGHADILREQLDGTTGR
ncbi:DinB family protein [Dactylosporangium sp. NPDC049525]|uniref:DinB family protein n=1 Tax=Dactylosporangium sp. NPDC049525 TaxID=3154730 RepID=UPI0034326C3B